VFTALEQYFIPAATPTGSSLSLDARFLHFCLNSHEDAFLPVDQIAGVVMVDKDSLLSVPEMPPYVLGITNWRGDMIWTVDLGYALGLEPLFLSHSGSIGLIILELKEGKERQIMGLAVPEIKDIELLDPGQFQQPTLGLFRAALMPYIQGYLPTSGFPVLSGSALMAGLRQS
jgi:positive phototaxis protein PixI